tara:strand:+ start:374 stop:1183 length:810 start_codon:yes stop_codon:yes gene_type:complete
MTKTMIKVMEENEKKEANKVEFKNSKKLKSFLQSAMNTATSLTKYIPKITDELIIVINQYKKNRSENVDLKDNKSRFDTFKSLREFAYGLVDYDPSIKANKIGSFEIVVERSIRSALMSVNKFGSIQVVEGELVAESKSVKPITKKENHDKRIKKKFINEPNKDTTLIPVNTSAIDDMWKRYNGTGTSGTKGKLTISNSASKFYADLHEVYDLAQKKKYEQFWSSVSQSTLETILDIKALLSDDLIRNTFDYCENNIQANGSIKKVVNQ